MKAWPPKKPVVFFTSFRYQAKGWTRARRVVAKVEWHQGELYPRVGFMVTNNLSRPNRGVVKFYNGRGTAEQWINAGRGRGAAVAVRRHPAADRSPAATVAAAPGMRIETNER